MGADKWAQVRDPAWYDGSVAARDAALARLAARARRAPARASRSSAPRRSSLPEHLGAVSSSAARAGNHDLIAPECRPAGAADRRRQQRHREPARRLVARSRRRRPAAGRVTAGARAPRAAIGSRVVLDGRPLADLPEGVHDGVLVAYATRAGSRRRRRPHRRGGRAATAIRGSLVVVTSDRALAERVRALGADVEGAGTLLAQLDG